MSDNPVQAPARSTPQRARRLLYIVSADWYFLSHRLPMARAAQAAGFEVHVATGVKDGAARIAAEGFTLHAIPFRRGRLSPYAALRTIAALRGLLGRLRPDIVHCISLQPSVYGGIAALGRHQPAIYAMTGLGFTFTSDTAKARAIRPLVGALLRFLFNRRDACVLVQNGDDRQAMERIGVDPQRIVTIAGSGVDTDRLVPMPEPISESMSEPGGEITVGFAGRLLDDKGIRPLVAAHRLLRQRGYAIRLMIAGTPDPANPTSVTEAEVGAWSKEPGITWLGHVTDIATLWRQSHIAALPSRREGLPKTLLEAAACGRPMVATDVPGCREVTIAVETGLLVPPDDPQALADAIARLADDAALRARYGVNARRLAEERCATPLIAEQITALYRKMIAR